MQEQFKGFYQPKEEEVNNVWRSENTIFVFDTNVFLNLYSYAKSTRDDFFELLEAIKEKLWIPYHVGLEYQIKRLEVISREKRKFSDIEKALAKINGIFDKDFNSLKLDTSFPALHEKTERLRKEIQKSISHYNRSLTYWEKKQPCVRAHDDIRENIDRLFNSKVGEAPSSQEVIDDVEKDGENRFSKKIPPGFEDKDKGKNDGQPHIFYNNLIYSRKFGDLHIWKQILNKAKSAEIENVVFITDDSKADWWYTISSSGEKQIGPLANLQAEIYNESNISNFCMYNTSDFLKAGEDILDVKVEKETLTDIRNNRHLSSLETSLLSKSLSRKYRDLINNRNQIVLSDQDIERIRKATLGIEGLGEAEKLALKLSSGLLDDQKSTFDSERILNLERKRLDWLNSFRNKDDDDEDK